MNWQNHQRHNAKHQQNHRKMTVPLEHPQKCFQRKSLGKIAPRQPRYFWHFSSASAVWTTNWLTISIEGSALTFWHSAMLKAALTRRQNLNRSSEIVHETSMRADRMEVQTGTAALPSDFSRFSQRKTSATASTCSSPICSPSATLANKARASGGFSMMGIEWRVASVRS